MAENLNSPPNNKETVNNPDLSLETFVTELEMSLSELTIEPSGHPQVTIEPSGHPQVTEESIRAELSLDPESEVLNFFDDQENIDNDIFDQENDDMDSDELDFGVGLRFSDDDDDYDIDSSYIDEYDDMNSNISVSYMGGVGGNEVFTEGENVGSDDLELVAGNVGGDAIEIDQDSPWISAGDWDVNDVGHLGLEEIDRLSQLADLVSDYEGNNVREEMWGEHGLILGVGDGEGWENGEISIHSWVVNVGWIQDEFDDGYFNENNYFIVMILEQSLLESVPENPTSRSVVENLDSVVFTQEIIENDCVMCAVCKEDFNVGTIAKKLPCSHHFHEDCILPWLEMRNTCPICRHGLPTDDRE